MGFLTFSESQVFHHFVCLKGSEGCPSEWVRHAGRRVAAVGVKVCTSYLVLLRLQVHTHDNTAVTAVDFSLLQQYYRSSRNGRHKVSI